MMENAIAREDYGMARYILLHFQTYLIIKRHLLMEHFIHLTEVSKEGEIDKDDMWCILLPSYN